MDEENERERRTMEELENDRCEKDIHRGSPECDGSDDILMEANTCLGNNVVDFFASVFNRFLQFCKWRGHMRIVYIDPNSQDQCRCSELFKLPWDQTDDSPLNIWERVISVF